MAALMNIAILIGSALALAFAGQQLVKSLSNISGFLRLKEFVVAFIVMAFSTSLPELFVGVQAALSGNSALALGNVIGSNIANLTIIIGIPVLVAKGLKVNTKEVRKDLIYMFFLAIIPIAMMWDRVIGRLDAVILLSIFGIYMFHMFKTIKDRSAKVEDHVSKWKFLLHIIVVGLALIVLFGSSRFLVESATALSLEFAVPPLLIGLFLVAIGTSLPELVFGLQAALKGHDEMALGTIIGSVITNATLVLGVTALINPITADFALFLTSAVFLIAISFLFVTFAESEAKLSWQEGASLIMFYVVFIIVQLNVQSLGILSSFG